MNGEVIVCYAKCWACIMDHCPNPAEPGHPWADDEDTDGMSPEESARIMAQTCACECNRSAA